MPSWISLRPCSTMSVFWVWRTWMPLSALLILPRQSKIPYWSSVLDPLFTWWCQLPPILVLCVGSIVHLVVSTSSQGIHSRLSLFSWWIDSQRSQSKLDGGGGVTKHNKKFFAFLHDSEHVLILIFESGVTGNVLDVTNVPGWPWLPPWDSSRVLLRLWGREMNHLISHLQRMTETEIDKWRWRPRPSSHFSHWPELVLINYFSKINFV